MEGVPRCPSCGSPMEKGCVGAESMYGGAKWFKSRTSLALGGEKVGDYRWDGMVWFDGYRCVGCRLLLLGFGTEPRTSLPRTRRSR